MSNTNFTGEEKAIIILGFMAVLFMCLWVSALNDFTQYKKNLNFPSLTIWEFDNCTQERSLLPAVKNDLENCLQREKAQSWECIEYKDYSKVVKVVEYCTTDYPEVKQCNNNCDGLWTYTNATGAYFIVDTKYYRACQEKCQELFNTCVFLDLDQDGYARINDSRCVKQALVRQVKQ
jgi:hypothetical protein